MTHTVRDKQKLLARVRRIRGQVEAIERALTELYAKGEVRTKDLHWGHLPAGQALGTVS